MIDRLQRLLRSSRGFFRAACDLLGGLAKFFGCRSRLGDAARKLGRGGSDALGGLLLACEGARLALLGFNGKPRCAFREDFLVRLGMLCHNRMMSRAVVGLYVAFLTRAIVVLLRSRFILLAVREFSLELLLYIRRAFRPIFRF